MYEFLVSSVRSRGSEISTNLVIRSIDIGRLRLAPYCLMAVPR